MAHGKIRKPSRATNRDGKFLSLKEKTKIRFPSIKINSKIWNLKLIKQGDQNKIVNDKDVIQKPSSKIAAKPRNSSLKEQSNKHIRPPNKVDEHFPTGRSSSEDRIFRSTVQVKTKRHLRHRKMIELCPRRRIARTESHVRTMTMNEIRRLTSTTKTKFHQIRSESVTGNYASNHTQRSAHSKESDSVTLFLKKNYKVAISSGLSTSCIHPINCVFNTDAGTNQLQGELV